MAIGMVCGNAAINAFTFIIEDLTFFIMYPICLDSCKIDFIYVRYIIQLFDIFVNRNEMNFMDLGKTIAFNLKKLRIERNMTLGQLSKISGISKTMLSDIEKGNSNPTINTIWKIANGLNVTYTKLMEGIEEESMLVRKGEPVMQTGESDYYRVYCYFGSSPVRNFELFYVELDPHRSNVSIGHSRKSQEYIYVVQGELSLHTDLGEYVLHQGDALKFDSSISHVYENKKEQLLILMIINYYPNC